MASLYTDVAGMLAAAGRPEDARRSVRDALETYQSIGMRRQIADTYRDSALLLADMGDPVEALRHCDEAIAIYRETGVPAEAVLPHNIAALVLYKAGRADEAMARLEMAVSAGEGQAIDPSLLATAYTGLGFLCEKTGDSRRALSSFVAAIDLLDSVRASLATGDLKLDFQGQERNLYSAAVKAFQVAGDAGMAFRYAEKAKSRVLLEQLRMTPLARPLSVDDRLAAREEALIDELNAAIRDGGPGGRSRDLERELDGLWRTMERSMPSSAGLKEYLSLRRGDSIGAGDLASYLTMTRFYEAYVTEKADKANALRAAQLFVRDLTIDDLLRYGESEAERKQLLDALGPAADNPGARPFCHPYYWSPFVLAGDWKSSGQRVLINSGKPPIRNISAGRWARSTSCWLAVKP
jgi:tetratricopeptide (TPR) repeat protein